MGKKSDLSPRKRVQIKVLLENKELTQCQMALKCGGLRVSCQALKRRCNMVQLALHNVKEDVEESDCLHNKMIEL